MKHRAGLFLTAAAATTICAGVAWSQSPTAAPPEGWIRSSPSHVSDADRSAMEQRLSQVAYRIRVGNADLCAGANTRLLGLISTFSDSAFSYDADQPREPLTISWVIPGGPAAGSGLREGDRILEIDGSPLPFKPAALDELNDRLRGYGNHVVSLGIERAGSRSRVDISPAAACDYQVELSESQDVDAFAEQRHAVISEGMLTLLPRDEELAVVVGHELGHIAAGHTQHGIDPSKRMEAEAEADYLGAYLTARAGYDISGAADVLRRVVAARHGGKADAGALAEIAPRFRAIEKATAEIAAKRSLGESLYPSSERLLRDAWN